MKNFLLLPLLFLLPFANAKAGLFEDIRRGVENAMPVSPRSIKCEQIRSDANDHQARINSELERTRQNLQDNLAEMASLDRAKLTHADRATALLQQLKFLTEFEALNHEMLLSDASYQTTLMKLQDNSTNQSLNEILVSMESDPKSPYLLQLAALIRNLSSKTESQLQTLIENGQMKTLLEQFNLLIGQARIFLIQEQSYLDATVTQSNKDLERVNSRRNEIETLIRQLGADYAAQEERKSCNF